MDTLGWLVVTKQMPWVKKVGARIRKSKVHEGIEPTSMEYGS